MCAQVCVIMTFEVEAIVREENDLLINLMISCEKCILTLSPPAFFFKVVSQRQHF